MGLDKLIESDSGARGNILAPPQHFREAPLGRKCSNFSFQNSVFWCIFVFLSDDEAPRRRGAQGSLPPLPHPLDGPGFRVKVKVRNRVKVSIFQKFM